MAQFLLRYYKKQIVMKKYSIIVALLIALGASISSCSTSGKVATKHHEVGVGAHVQ
jgi:hypothetical protein